LLAVGAALLALAQFTGCVFKSSGPISPASEPEQIRWIVVERAVRDLAPDASWVEGQVDPGAVVLTMVPVREEVTAWTPRIHAPDYFVELLGITPEGPSSPGEVVSATVRVGRAKPGLRYLLQAVSSQPYVKIIGRDHAVVSGEECATFKFTSRSSGKGGIEVKVRPVQEDSSSP
jgi:hypothetical protein